MGNLFRLSGTMKQDPAVDAFFREHEGELGGLALHWFERIRGCGHEVREVLHDGCPTACIDDAAFAYVGVFTRHVNIGFFRGSELNDPTGLLEGTGRFMRHVKLRAGRKVDSHALMRLIETAYADMKERIVMVAGDPDAADTN